MFSRRPVRGIPTFGGLGSKGGAPRDILVLLAVLFLTFSLQFFDPTRFLPDLLRLTPSVWSGLQVWRLLTYPFVGEGDLGIWFLLELLILFWFGRDIFARLGRRSFWILVGWGVITASVVAVALDLLGQLVPGISGPAPFALLQGQRTLLVIVIAAFATLFGNATVLLFFVLPVQAKWFLWIEILFAFMGFLGTKDLAGFVGICATVGVVYNLLTRGGLARGLRELWLRFEQRRIQAKMARMRRRSGLRVVKGDDDGAAEDRRDPWVH